MGLINFWDSDDQARYECSLDDMAKRLKEEIANLKEQIERATSFMGEMVYLNKGHDEFVKFVLEGEQALKGGE